MITSTDEKTQTQDVIVYGAGGMLAGELVRLLGAHPVFGLGAAVTRTGGEFLHELHPQLATDGVCVPAADVVRVLEESLQGTKLGGEAPWLVLALPHGETAAVWRAVRSELGDAADALRVVDLSADYRLQDAAAYERWYGRAHADPGELAEFVYGLPETSDVASDANRIAAPGCFATALQLATIPAAKVGVLDPTSPWVFHALTGSSGSGVNPGPGTHHPFRHGNVWSYAHGGHRHVAELEQALEPLDIRPPVTFLPHSAPWVRGIHLSAVLPLASPMTSVDAHDLFATAYDAQPFVDVLTSQTPDLRRVVGSNAVALSARVQNSGLVVELTLDNLIKGGSGQALQAMNLAAGLPAQLGLSRTGLGAI